jgi:hypothetical protein
MKTNRITILSIAIAFAIILLAIPVSAEPLNTTTPDGKYSNPYPDKVFGEQFRSLERPLAGGYTVGDEGPTWSVKWTFIICLTDEQNEQLREWMFNDWDMPLIDALTQLVPEQVAALPEDLVRYLNDHPYITVYNRPQPPCWSNPGDGDVWKDPCNTVVPLEDVPLVIKDGINYHGVPLYDDINTYEYTNEVKMHLANLGLSTDATTADIFITTSIPNGRYTITIQAKTPDGTQKSWTFRKESDGTWIDVNTGLQMNEDMQYVLAAWRYVDPPNESGAPVSQVKPTNTFDVAARSKSIISSHTSNTFANTLLSHAGISKLSNVNISSLAATRATIATTASTASLVSQDTVSSSDETTTGGTFDMASFAASYRSGGTAIASKSFGSDILAARGIGG